MGKREKSLGTSMITATSPGSKGPRIDFHSGETSFHNDKHFETSFHDEKHLELELKFLEKVNLKICAVAESLKGFSCFRRIK